jgi:protein translocase SecG subunit
VEWLKTLLIVLQVISALAVILLVLLQQGKGADMGAAFGSGASGSLFGASGSGKSFVALDMAAAIAQGIPWRDHRTVKGRVLIIA